MRPPGITNANSCADLQDSEDKGREGVRRDGCSQERDSTWGAGGHSPWWDCPVTLLSSVRAPPWGRGFGEAVQRQLLGQGQGGERAVDGRVGSRWKQGENTQQGRDSVILTCPRNRRSKGHSVSSYCLYRSPCGRTCAFSRNATVLRRPHVNQSVSVKPFLSQRWHGGESPSARRSLQHSRVTQEGPLPTTPALSGTCGGNTPELVFFSAPAFQPLASFTF